MKRTLKFVLAGVMVAVGFGAQAADVQSRLIRFGYGLAEDSVQGRAANFFAEEVARLSDGKLKVRAFCCASLGNDNQMQAALVGGAQEMMVGSTATLVGIVKEFGVFDLPFLFKNPETADKVLDGPFGQKLLDKLPEYGLIGLVYWENGFRDLTNSQRPITSAEDLSGIKLRVMQNPVFLDVFSNLGANAVPMPFAELFTALETGTVDGQENPVTTIQTSKFYEVQKYLTISRHVYSPWIVTASEVWWDKLSDDEKNIMRQAADASRDFERKDSRESTQKALVYLQEQGMEINELSDGEVQKMQEKVKPVVDKYQQELGEDTVNELYEAIDQAGQQ